MLDTSIARPWLAVAFLVWTLLAAIAGWQTGREQEQDRCTAQVATLKADQATQERQAAQAALDRLQLDRGRRQPAPSAGGPVGLTLLNESASEPSRVGVQLTDHGLGMTPDQLARVFERFYSLPRPDKGKSSGLGLSFATEVARQHGGRLTLANQPDGGVLAELWLPGN